MKTCKVNIKPPKAPCIKEVIWFPPFHSWIKVNTDGASVQNPSRAAASGIFKNSDGVCLAQFLGPVSALIAELSTVMAATELAASNGFHNVWLESDSQLVILAFKSNFVVPWSLRNKWENCLQLTHRMGFRAIHIYREGNVCADILANFGLSLLA